MGLAPYRKDFMAKLVAGGGGSDEEVMAGIGAIHAKFATTVKQIDTFLKHRNIETK